MPLHVTTHPLRRISRQAWQAAQLSTGAIDVTLGTVNLSTGIAPTVSVATWQNTTLSATASVDLNTGTVALTSGLAPTPSILSWQTTELLTSSALDVTNGTVTLATGITPTTTVSVWQNTVLSVAYLDLDFATTSYSENGTMTALSSVLSTTRSTIAQTLNASSLWTPVAANTARVNGAGALVIEEARTNVITSNNYTDPTYGAIAWGGHELMLGGGSSNPFLFSGLVNGTTYTLPGTDLSTSGSSTTAIAGGGIALTCGATGVAIREFQFSVLAGTWYTIQETHEYGTGTANVTLQIGTTSGGTDVQAATSVSPEGSRYNRYYAASTTTWYFRVSNSTANSVTNLYAVSCMDFSYPSWAAGAGFGGLPLAPAARTLTSVTQVATDANGLPSMTLRVQRQMAGSGATGCILYFVNQSAIPAANGQSWILSLYASMSAGSQANVSNFSLGYAERNSAESTLAFIANTVSISSTSTRLSYAATLAAGATVAYAVPYLELNLAASGNIDVSLTLSGTQMELVPALPAAPSSPIITTNGSVTRAADLMTTFLSGWAEGAIIVNVTAPAAIKQATLFSWDDGSASNNILLQMDASGVIHFIVTVSGVQQCNISSQAVVAGQVFKVAAFWQANLFACSVNGAQAGTGMGGTVPTMLARILVGSDSTGNYLNGLITRLTLIDGVLNPAGMPSAGGLALLST